MKEEESPIEKTIGYVRECRYGRSIILVIIGCLIFDIIFIFHSFFPKNNLGAMYFFNVGQGDSQLVVFPEGGTILIDGGPPNGLAEKEISRIVGPFTRSLDLVLLSHPQEDHFGGLIGISEHYRIGAFLDNGEISQSDAYESLEKNLFAQGVRRIAVFGGDKIRQGESSFRIVWPLLNKKESVKYDPNDRAIVGEVFMNGGRALFTGDINERIEDIITSLIFPSDILKVSHHGSRYSSGTSFLSALNPRVAVIGVGKNSYGHPSPETLKRLSMEGISIFRTDIDGTIKIIFEDGYTRVFSVSSL